MQHETEIPVPEKQDWSAPEVEAAVVRDETGNTFVMNNPDGDFTLGS